MSIEKAQVIKSLESQLKVISGKVKAKKEEVVIIQKEYSQLLLALKKKIETYKVTTDLKITEHAILRYLERVNKINLEEIQNIILTPELLKMTKTLGDNGKFPIGGFRVVVKDNTIVTIEI